MSYSVNWLSRFKSLHSPFLYVVILWIVTLLGFVWMGGISLEAVELWVGPRPALMFFNVEIHTPWRWFILIIIILIESFLHDVVSRQKNKPSAFRFYNMFRIIWVYYIMFLQLDFCVVQELSSHAIEHFHPPELPDSPV